MAVPADSGGGSSTTTAVKKRRAAMVCIACHARKIKCDVKSRSDEGHSDCSKCSAANQACELRPSKRGKRQRASTSAEVQDTSELPTAAGISVPSLSSTSFSRSSPPFPRADGFSESLPVDSGTIDFALDLQSMSTSGLREGTGSSSINNNSNSVLSAAATDLLSISGQQSQNSYNDTCQTSLNPLLSITTSNNPSSLGASILIQPQHPTGFSNSSALSTDTRIEGPTHSYASGDVDTGYQNIYSVEHARLAAQEEISTSIDQYFKSDLNPISEDLQESFSETYFEYCYVFCPVLDRISLNREMSESVLLANAVALAASHIRPPLVAHEGPATYYERARKAFYYDEEMDGLTALKALCLFNWWAPRGPSTVHRHSSWWWQSVIIRHAQQANFHREPPVGHPSRDRLNLSLRRRIWWTAFARERLTALCQSKPCIIDPSDCNIIEPQASDFAEDSVSQKRGRIFTHWVRLCGIIGRVAKRLANSDVSSLTDLQLILVDWIQALPTDLALPISFARTSTFDRDVHQLHLPYLTTIIVLNLKRSAHDLPDALPPAIVAASCTVRIFRDILARGNTRFLMPITSWYTGMAFIPLLQAARMPLLAVEANESLDVLLCMCVELEKMWGSAAIIRAGCERMRRESAGHESRSAASGKDHNSLASDLDNFDWPALFPFVSQQTNKTVACLLDDKANGSRTRGMPSPTDLNFYESMQDQYKFLTDPFAGADFTNYDDQSLHFALP